MIKSGRGEKPIKYLL